MRATIIVSLCLLLVWTPTAPVAAEPRAVAETTLLRGSIQDETGMALRNFSQALKQTLTHTLRNGKERITRIVQYGDSHTAGDITTGALRRQLQTMFGDAGPGFILPGFPYPWFSRRGVQQAASSGWRMMGFPDGNLPGDGQFGLTGVSLNTNRAGEWLRLTTDSRNFEVYLLQQPAGGMVEILLDGAPVRRGVSLDAAWFEPTYLEFSTRYEGPHTLEIRTVSSGAVRVLGVAAEKSRAGVVYDVFGINGARASRPLQWDWKLLSDNLKRRNPDLIVIAYGTNEVSDADFTAAGYQAAFSELLRRFHTVAPQASLLVLAPPDRAVRSGAGWHSHPNMSALVEAQRRAAREAGAAFFDLFHAMGGPGSINQWAQLPQPLAQPDRVHLSKQGYLLVAECLFPKLTRQTMGPVWADWRAFFMKFLNRLGLKRF
ncbi:MAG: hypothetical protein K1Y36_02005 [Blastocatellia bacterium]|nr:hypothetical protein [Blastocatellia bacterium]